MTELTKDERKKIVKGDGNWKTTAIPGKIESVMMTDGPHGVRKQYVDKAGENNNSIPATCFPTASACSCSWDPELMKKMAESIAEEAMMNDVSIILGCGINIKRSPLCGRNFEYYSEDPLLAARLGTAYIRAMEEKGVATSLKHFAVNSQETNRMTSNSRVDERALREIYLLAFEKIVREAKPSTIMASYNMVNGKNSCENKYLLTDILRKEWGYQGLVMSDWGASIDINRSLNAGLDLEMPENKSHFPSEKTEDAALERASRNVINLVEKSLERKKSYKFYSEEEKKDVLKKNAEIAMEIQSESIVLLQNNGILPLGTPEETKKIIIIGELGKKMRFQGGGSSHINATHTPDAVQAFTEAGYDVTYIQGYRADTAEKDEELEKEMISVLRNSDRNAPVLFCGGLPEAFEGEGFDRTNLSIPQNQLDLLDAIYPINTNIIFINQSGSAVEMPFSSHMAAILHLYLGGQETDRALVKIISGEKNPCGKLSETFPNSVKEIPCFEYFGHNSENLHNIDYRESIFIGYRYYDTYHQSVKFPFGHGLSYTSFQYSDASFDGKKVIFTLSNTGTKDGKEIVQVYVKNPEGDFLREEKQLKGFTKVELKAGESKKVEIELDDTAFCIFDTEKHKFVKVGGTYEILIGTSSRDILLSMNADIPGEKILRNDRTEIPEYFGKYESTFSIPKDAFDILMKRSQTTGEEMYIRPAVPERGEFSKYNSMEQLAEKSLFSKIILKVILKMMKNLYPGRSENDPEIRMSMDTAREASIEGIQGLSDGALPKRVEEAMIFSANGKKVRSVFKLIFG